VSRCLVMTCLGGDDGCAPWDKMGLKINVGTDTGFA
jgi:hypothetical protein